MNEIEEAIVIGSKEQSGLWEVLNDVASLKKVDRGAAFELVKAQLEFINQRSDIYLIRSTGLYDSDTCTVLDKSKLAALTLRDVEFRSGGPFYYFSHVPGI